MARYHGTKEGYKHKDYTSKSKAKLKAQQEKERSKRRRSSLPLGGTSDNVIASKWTWIQRIRLNLTFSTDYTYFWGRAGLMRIATLFMGCFSLCLSFPGNSAISDAKSSDKAGKWILQYGYGESIWMQFSILCNVICILISIIYLLLLLWFREVRCQARWDEINMEIHVLGCIIGIISAFSHLLGVNQTRVKNCGVDCVNQNLNTHARAIQRAENMYRPEFYITQYMSWMSKLIMAMCFSCCSRIFLKNDDQLF